MWMADLDFYSDCCAAGAVRGGGGDGGENALMSIHFMLPGKSDRRTGDAPVFSPLMRKAVLPMISQQPEWMVSKRHITPFIVGWLHTRNRALSE
ncbi:unnamed protein product [Sphagnum jensenii]